MGEQSSRVALWGWWWCYGPSVGWPGRLWDCDQPRHKSGNSSLSLTTTPTYSDYHGAQRPFEASHRATTAEEASETHFEQGIICFSSALEAPVGNAHRLYPWIALCLPEAALQLLQHASAKRHQAAL